MRERAPQNICSGLKIQSMQFPFIYDSIMISSVANFFGMGGGGGQAPQMYRQKEKNHVKYARASEASERFRNTFHRPIFSGFKIHLHTYTINVVHFYQNMVWRCRYKRQYDKNTNIEKNLRICERASLEIFRIFTL